MAALTLNRTATPLDRYGPALVITDALQAHDYLMTLVAWRIAWRKPLEKACYSLEEAFVLEQQALADYAALQGDNTLYHQVLRVFGITHRHVRA